MAVDEALADLADHASSAERAVLEDELGLLDHVRAHRLLDARDAKAGRALLDDEGGDAALARAGLLRR